LLCTGDLHLGRHPSRIPEELDGPELSSKSVWQSIVQEAIDRDVDGVVIAGDIVDRANRYFEAYGAFEDGLARLDDRDVPVVAVAGNHDFDVLPEMATNLDSDALQFLGRGGSWERWTLERDGEPLAHFDGWSFPDEHVYDSPLDGYDLPEAGDAPLIGVVHADLDSRGSRYGPVTSSDLRETSAVTWVLGHIHDPGVRIDSGPLALYPGSPQPLDPGERRAHGPWLVTIPPNGSVSAEQVPLASVRCDRIEIDASGADTPQSVAALISAGIEDHVRSELDASSLELSLVSVRLTGRTDAHSALLKQHRSMERDLEFREGSVAVRIESIAVDTRPRIDLEELSRGDNAAAYLANLLLEIENGEPRDTYRSEIDDSLAAMRRAHSANAYTPLRRETEPDDPDEAAAIETIEQQARVLLDTLLSQKDDTT
jgi:DNA repair exonuclease SbcCD nuclease subunit